MHARETTPRSDSPGSPFRFPRNLKKSQEKTTLNFSWFFGCIHPIHSEFLFVCHLQESLKVGSIQRRLTGFCIRTQTSCLQLGLCHPLCLLALSFELTSPGEIYEGETPCVFWGWQFCHMFSAVQWIHPIFGSMPLSGGLSTKNGINSNKGFNVDMCKKWDRFMEAFGVTLAP